MIAPPLLKHRLALPSAMLTKDAVALGKANSIIPPQTFGNSSLGDTPTSLARVARNNPRRSGSPFLTRSEAEGDPDLGAIRPAAQTAGLDHDRGRPREEGRENILHLDLDLVAHPHELGTYVLRDPRINLQALALVVNARPAGRVLRAVAVVQRIDDGLDDRAHDLPSAGRAARQQWTIRAQHERRRARPEHALARRYRVRPLGTWIEPVRPIGDQHSGAARHDGRPETTAERRRKRYEHPIAVHRVHVRGVRKIGHRGEPLAECGPGRSGDPVQALGAELRPPTQVLPPEPLERSGDRRPARETWKREHAMAAIVKRERRKLARLVRRKVPAREDSSERANVVDDRRPEITPIERLCAIAGDRLEGARQIRLHETLGRLESGRRPIGRATFAVVHPLRLRILVQPRRERPEDERAVPIDEETLSGKTDRRFEETSPGQLAEAAVSELVCRDSARHAHRQGTLGIGVVFHRGPSVHAGSRIPTPELEHVLARREWR